MKKIFLFSAVLVILLSATGCAWAAAESGTEDFQETRTASPAVPPATVADGSASGTGGNSSGGGSEGGGSGDNVRNFFRFFFGEDDSGEPQPCAGMGFLVIFLVFSAIFFAFFRIIRKRKAADRFSGGKRK